MSKNCHVISFSGGKDSTAMLFKMLEDDKYKINKNNLYIVFADTGVEYPEMHQHIKHVDDILIDKYDLEIIRIYDKNGDFIYYMTEYKHKCGKYAGCPHGFPTYKYRWCSNYLKITPFEQFYSKLRKEKGYSKFFIYIGYSLDEIKRTKYFCRKNKENEIIYRAPLIEKYNMNEEDCLNYCMEKYGFDWGGLYEQTNRISCWICPLKKMDGHRFIIEERPKFWKIIKQIEHDLHYKYNYKYWKFTPRYSCDELEEIILTKYSKRLRR